MNESDGVDEGGIHFGASSGHPQTVEVPVDFLKSLMEKVDLIADAQKRQKKRES